jgi:hypothetical protein
MQDHTDGISRAETADITSGVTVRGHWSATHDRIFGVASSHVEATLLLSAIDIALGAFRYCLEHPTADVSATMFQHLVRLLPETGRELHSWIDRRLFFSPRIETVKVGRYREHCEAVVHDLRGMLVSAR